MFGTGRMEKINKNNGENMVGVSEEENGVFRFGKRQLITMYADLSTESKSIKSNTNLFWVRFY